MGVKKPESWAEPPRSLEGLKSRGGVDILNLDSSAKNNTQILVGVDDFDQRPAGALDLGESWAKCSVRAVLGTQDDSLIAVDTEAGSLGEAVDNWEGQNSIVDGVGSMARSSAGLNHDVVERC